MEFYLYIFILIVILIIFKSKFKSKQSSYKLGYPMLINNSPKYINSCSNNLFV